MNSLRKSRHMMEPGVSTCGWRRCFAIGNPNAKQVLGQDERTFKDPTGKTFGLDFYAVGQKPEGQITKVSYMFVRPGPDKNPMPKVSLVTKVTDLVCGVGYYK